jgi:hypothetical protein
MSEKKNIIEESFSSETDSQSREFNEDNMFSLANKVSDSDSGYIRNLIIGTVIFFGTIILISVVISLAEIAKK